ncbi:MAG: type II toxin-antitoxin system VapC family toxin [bacterium]
MILDTTAVSSLLGNEAGIEQVVQRVDRPYLPVIVIGEFRYGLKQSLRRSMDEAAFQRLESGSHILPIDAATALVYADIRDELRRAGSPIPANDLWIASLGRQHGLPVATRDAHFDLVSGLKRISW